MAKVCEMADTSFTIAPPTVTIALANKSRCCPRSKHVPSIFSTSVFCARERHYRPCDIQRSCLQTVRDQSTSQYLPQHSSLQPAKRRPWPQMHMSHPRQRRSCPRWWFSIYIELVLFCDLPLPILKFERLF